MSHTWKVYLAIGILGAAALAASVVGVVAGQVNSSTASGSTDPAASVPLDLGGTSGMAYRLSPPNELGRGGDLGGLPASGERVPYRLRPPNETGAGGSGAGSPAWSDARDYAPATARPATDHGQQRRLFEIEVRDNGAGTSGGPCLITPEHLCP